jgi:hypothetical protein
MIITIIRSELEKLKFIFTKRTGGARGRFEGSLLD